MLFLSSHCSSVTTRCGMRRFHLTSSNAGHDQPFPDFLLCFLSNVLHAVHVLCCLNQVTQSDFSI